MVKIIKKKKAFRIKVLETVSKIPKGKTMGYKEVAILAGKPKACRAVGNILSKNFDPAIPCHRVIRSDGKTGGYNKGRKKKIELLKKEKEAEKINRLKIRNKIS